MWLNSGWRRVCSGPVQGRSTSPGPLLSWLSQNSLLTFGSSWGYILREISKNLTLDSGFDWTNANTICGFIISLGAKLGEFSQTWQTWMTLVGKHMSQIIYYILSTAKTREIESYHTEWHREHVIDQKTGRDIGKLFNRNKIIMIIIIINNIYRDSLFCISHCSTCITNSLVLVTTLWIVIIIIILNFTDEETEAQKAEVNFPVSQLVSGRTRMWSQF